MDFEQQQANEEFHHMVVNILAKLVDSVLSTEELTIICMACGVDTQELMGSEPYVSPPIEENGVLKLSGRMREITIVREPLLDDSGAPF